MLPPSRGAGTALTRRPALLALAAAVTQPRPPVTAAEPAPRFSLEVPAGFVSIGRRGDADYLLVTGNFATGTLLSVQQLRPTDLRVPLSAGDDAAALRLATALGALRDKAQGVDATSAVRNARARGQRAIDFELTTPLVGDKATPAQLADPELVRTTLARALLLPDGPAGEPGAGLLVVWAGAKQSFFDAGDGELLRAAVDSFSLKTAD